VRALDRYHLGRIRRAHRDFEAALRPLERPVVARHRGQLEELLESCTAFAVAGGHVAVLLNRLRLFGIAPLVRGRPVFAWSAGAMVLGERVVLFHDDPPQGRGDAEVLESGLGLYSGVLPLPHARHRLRLGETTRVGLFAQRFAEQQCVAMDEGAELAWDGQRWSPSGQVRRLERDGTVTELAA
jgi:peptidase E